ncbi:platelet-activating factor acetylhydrolase, isoform II-domain-containing protein [Immersiella caudata]|uniref:1-alkyl-2-acetylglycerophosphocholine esterase n=1 Tax=Immersiella caudata TaxID=314043 RepID=A0AA40CBA2_9PEZI|nr:platelet-activating factor acetylhydrolase, isoform II-domain-containing protein [Immersiella caudata]
MKSKSFAGLRSQSRAPSRRSSPKSHREHFLHSLPAYSGPCSVSYLEFEIPVRKPRHFSHIKRNGSPALKLDTVLFSIYYLCDTAPSLSRPPWLPRPRPETCNILSVPGVLVTAYLALTSMFTKLPAYRNAPLSRRRPASATGGGDGPTSSSSNSSSTTLPNNRQFEKRVSNEQSGKPPIFPIVIFSHGLGGSRTSCSAICGELASLGFVVVALEHRDGSGARIFINKAGAAEEGGQEKEGDSTQNILYDTSPHNKRGIDTELRGAQMEMRLAEIEEAFYVLGSINAGHGEQLREQNLRKAGNVGLYLGSVTVMGHSFGGTTAAQALRLDKFGWVGQAVLLDPWGPVLKTFQKPILSVGSEAFMHWTECYERIQQICREARDVGALCWSMTIKGSTHISQTDFARAIHLTIYSALEFLKITLPPQRTKFDASKEQLLSNAADPETNALFDHRPKDHKFIAARLFIPDEFSLRIRGFIKRCNRWGNRDPNLPTDASGKPLVGPVNWGAGKDMLVHMAPEQEDMEAYMRRAGGQ